MSKMPQTRVYDHILNFRSNNIKAIDESIMAIPAILKNLNNERIVSEFIPYLIKSPSLTEENWCDILSCLEYINFGQMTPDQHNKFLNSIKILSIIDSPSLRQKLCDIVSFETSKMSTDCKLSVLAPFIVEQLQSDWNPTQAWAVLVFPFLTEYLDKGLTLQMFKIFQTIRNSDSTLVLSCFIDAAATICLLMQDKADKLYSIIFKIAETEKSLRVQLHIPIFLASYVHATNNIELSMKICEKQFSSENWKIRENVILYLSKISPTYNSILDNIVDQAIDDPDHDVRITLARQIGHFIFDDVERAMEILDQLLFDKYGPVREKAVASIAALADVLGMKYTTEKFIGLLQDDFDETKIVAIEAIKSSNISFSCILDEIVAQYPFMKWRVKHSIAQLVSEYIQEGDQPPQKLAPVVGMLLHDEAAAVRLAMAEGLEQLSCSVPTDWLEGPFVALLDALSRDDDYQVRQAAAIASSAAGIGEKGASEILIRLSQDTVSNVRLTVAQVVPLTLLDIVKKLEDDSDEDVRDAINAR